MLIIKTKNITKIALLIVASLMIASFVIDLINSIPGIYSAGGWAQLIQSLKHLDDPNLRQYFQYFTGILKAIMLIIIAGSAIYFAFNNKFSYSFIVFSVLMLGMFVFDLVVKAQSGAFTNKKATLNIFQLLFDSISQIGYVLTFILLKKKRINKNVSKSY